MTDKLIVLAALFLIYYHISGLATTNILRLTAGCKTPVLAGKCYCDACGAVIPPLLQLPIFSYIVCGGKCRSCGARIPVFPLALELTALLGMFGITALLGCSAWGVSASFLYYEALRLFCILRLGRREERFARQYAIAVAAMLPFYAMTQFVALLYRIV